MSLKNPVEQMLRLAHTTTASHFQYYHNAALNVETAEVKALLMVLADTEAELMDQLKSMMIRGIIAELEELSEATDRYDSPDEMPFDLSREETDPRIFVCNRALEKELKGYTFFLSIAARAKSKVISRLFEYLSYVKVKQIVRIRKVCESF
jgi:rubrerythrin